MYKEQELTWTSFDLPISSHTLLHFYSLLLRDAGRLISIPLQTSLFTFQLSFIYPFPHFFVARWVRPLRSSWFAIHFRLPTDSRDNLFLESTYEFHQNHMKLALRSMPYALIGIVVLALNLVNQVEAASSSYKVAGCGSLGSMVPAYCDGNSTSGSYTCSCSGIGVFGCTERVARGSIAAPEQTSTCKSKGCGCQKNEPSPPPSRSPSRSP